MALTGERITVDKTYAQMEALIAAEELNPFLWYKITDRGDRGLVFRAAAVNRLESNGTRYMLCPETYAVGVDAYDNDWIGVWNATKQATATTGQLCIWNGLVWTAGETMDGNAPDTETSGWTVIPKASFTNHEYVEMIFGVTYDFEDDWINKQWDNEDNYWGVPRSVAETVAVEFGITGNPIDCCDWNYRSTGKFLYSNHNYFCINNSITGDLFMNHTPFILQNSINGSIYSNMGNIPIFLNRSLADAPVDIRNNYIDGTITGVWDADVTDPIVNKIGTA